MERQSACVFSETDDYPKNGCTAGCGNAIRLVKDLRLHNERIVFLLFLPAYSFGKVTSPDITQHE